MSLTKSEAVALFGRTYSGVVDAVHYNGASQNGGYTASQVTYDVWVNMDTGPVLILGVTPFNDRPKESANIIPARVTSPAIVMSVGAKLIFWITEHYDVGACA